MPDDNMPEDSAKLGEFLCFSVYAAGHAFNRVYKPLLDRIGLTYPQYLVMVLLWERDDQTVGALGTRLSLESSTLTPLLKRIEKLGFLVRLRDTKDERQVRVRLTDAGRALQAKAKDVPLRILEATGLSVEALQRLKTEISALSAALEAY